MFSVKTTAVFVRRDYELLGVEAASQRLRQIFDRGRQLQRTRH